MPRIQVSLNDVVCNDTEDVVGADEFYLLGTVSDGAQNTTGVVTEPISISKGQTLAFRGGGGLVLDAANVSDARSLKVAFRAFDEDSNKDWPKREAWVKQIADAVSGGLSTIPNPYTAAASALLPFAVQAVGGLMMLDKDDNLGEYSHDEPIRGLMPGENPRSWAFHGKWGGGLFGWSTWSYVVRYSIRVQ